ncbi:MAG: hypothetical protein HOD07_03950 [Gammaproteobacteria bacterium]|jgi:hypothetical protein|nr:hypothetical protein [Gammaproteobacteria bacterium]MBT4581190.1 hypothetical protein [Gammaproteobacteria bacterium]
MDYNFWLSHIREALQAEAPLACIKEGKWSPADRRQLWKITETRTYDAHIEKFKSIAVKVLSEIDPQFELDPNERYAADIHGKRPKYSSILRNGIVETLAILGTNPGKLNCSKHHAESTSLLVIREVLSNPDWKLWASINDLLPVLAESSPGEFLSAVEKVLGNDPCPFAELFKQEDTGVLGRNYLTGALWALEGLAWNPEYLVRVAVVLAELASIDPGGNWANRPINSLKTILLPWFPQTFAEFDKRYACIAAIRGEHPDVAWEVLISLLPNQHQTSSGSHKPKFFMSVHHDWRPEVPRTDYTEQVNVYSDYAVQMAKDEPGRLALLVDNLDNLPPPYFNEVIEHLASMDPSSVDPELSQSIWQELVKFSTKHRRHSDADWALPEEQIIKIEEVSTVWKPSDPVFLHRRLFSDHAFDLYEEAGNWQEQQRVLEEKRQEALSLILSAYGLDGILGFKDAVESPFHVGWSLGAIADDTIEEVLVPSHLVIDEPIIKFFIKGFVQSRFQVNGWEWVKRIDRTNWSLEETSCFLQLLPFDEQTWEYVDEWLGEEAGSYWMEVVVNPYQTDGNLLVAIDRLLSVSRSYAALECLYVRRMNKLPIEFERTVDALLGAVAKSDADHHVHSYHITELIKALQECDEIDEDKLFRVEWAYLPLLERGEELQAKTLQRNLSSKPELFCEAIRAVYKSTKDDRSEDVETDEATKEIASNAWKLLHSWNRPPGLLDDGQFSFEKFSDWFDAVRASTEESGHLEVSLIKIGEVLFYTPSDPSGLWINQQIAQFINTRELDEIRRGYSTEVYNSRGVHWVDPSGNQEIELSEHWRGRAEEIEVAGYPRFAATLRGLADSYIHEAERVKVDIATERD